MRAALVQTPEMPPGTAELRCQDSGMQPGTVELCLSRPLPSGGLRHLDPANPGQPWGNPEVWQRPVAAEGDGTLLRLRLDAFATWHLAPNTPYILQLRDAAGRRAETPLLGIAMRLPSAPPKGWGAPGAVAEEAPPPPPPAAPPMPQAPVADPAPERSGGGARRGRPALLTVLALLLLLVLAGAAAWWVLDAPPADAPVAEAPPPATAAPEPEPQPTLEAARAALADNPPAAEARTLGEAHLAARDREGAFLLLRYAAEQGDAVAARAVAALYDPATWSAETSPLPAPNAEQAAQWYRRAAEAGDAEAQYRLGMLLRDGGVESADGAEVWLRRAAGQGHTGAKEALAQ